MVRTAQRPGTPREPAARGRLTRSLSALADPSALAVFRIGFSSLVAWEVWRAFDGNQIRADYDAPAFLFRWWLFDWVRPLPGIWLYLAFGALGVAALLVAAGAFYRVASVAQFFGLAYWFLLEKSAYLNHRYLAVLFAFLLIFVPANAAWSVDRRRLSANVRSWTVWLLRFQVGVPYFFAGLAKLNFDWLVRNEPLGMWLATMTDFPLVGRFFMNAGVVRFMAFGSAALDLFVVFFLLHRRTRAWAYGAAVVFHLLNARLFDIGIFPWMMIVATTVFFEPDWPRRFMGVLRSGAGRGRGGVLAGAVGGFLVGGLLPPTFVPMQALIGAFGVSVFVFHVARPERAEAQRAVASVMRRPAIAALAVWCAVQLLMPLRHFVIPGNVHWTEEGQRFSWHMLLDSKTKTVKFDVTDAAGGRTWTEPLERHLTAYQIRKLRSPDQMLTFAHYLEAYYGELGYDDVEVRTRTLVSLNGRKRQRLIDAKRDLTRIGRPYLPPADWIVPLKDFED